MFLHSNSEILRFAKLNKIEIDSGNALPFGGTAKEGE